MARLNEVHTVASESVEAVRRKYMRQNREIVRVNTAQSARIRNLECEVSRLLNENLELREAAINARVEAENAKAADKISKEVLRIKDEMLTKLSDMTDLVRALDVVPEKMTRRSSQKRRQDGFVSDMIKPSDVREHRRRNSVLEQEGRLPAILEDKSYPRKTLEPQEILALLDDENEEQTESPELGPPPVAHFDDAEVVEFDTSKSPRRTSLELLDEWTAIAAEAMQENKPRKRRNSSLLAPADLEETEQKKTKKLEAALPPPVPEPEKKQTAAQTQSILKKGAKRKLEASELEDNNRVSKELDDFIFQRRAAAPATTARPSRFSKPSARSVQETKNEAPASAPERTTRATRKVLAPKSTNSPSKTRAGISEQKPTPKEEQQRSGSPERKTVSRRRSRLAPIDSSNDKSIKQGPEDYKHAQPNTPASELDDILSPISAEPSTKQRPKTEAAITNSVEDVLNGSIGRASRRARAAVSYAEPNLRDKMRRPGKELVSAVQGLPRRSMDSEPARGRSVTRDDVPRRVSYIRSRSRSMSDRETPSAAAPKTATSGAITASVTRRRLSDSRHVQPTENSYSRGRTTTRDSRPRNTINVRSRSRSVSSERKLAPIGLTDHEASVIAQHNSAPGRSDLTYLRSRSRSSSRSVSSERRLVPIGLTEKESRQIAEHNSAPGRRDLTYLRSRSRSISSERKPLPIVL